MGVLKTKKIQQLQNIDFSPRNYLFGGKIGDDSGPYMKGNVCKNAFKGKRPSSEGHVVITK